MKALVVYDSVFGNTGHIAQTVGQMLGSQENVQTIQVSETKSEQLTGLELLIVGSPTRQFRPTGAIKAFLKAIPNRGLAGVKVAAFDTRFPMSEIEKSRVLPFFVRLFGYAAKPIADGLAKKGGELALPPEGFFVEGVEGPLQPGELERAADWAQQIVVTLPQTEKNV
jgi:flavodoxin